MKEKLELLCRIADRFNEQGILWAAGGSTILYFKNLVSKAHDLDIMIDVKDEQKAMDILLSMGKHLLKKNDSKFGSKVFEQFEIEGIGVDLIGDFSIFEENKEYIFPVQRNRLEMIEVHSSHIYLESLEDWIERYRLMGREEKARMIEEALDE